MVKSEFKKYYVIKQAEQAYMERSDFLEAQLKRLKTVRLAPDFAEGAISKDTSPSIQRRILDEALNDKDGKTNITLFDYVDYPALQELNSQSLHLINLAKVTEKPYTL